MVFVIFVSAFGYGFFVFFVMSVANLYLCLFKIFVVLNKILVFIFGLIFFYVSNVLSVDCMASLVFLILV